MKVLVFGTFDVLHPGHHFVLDAAMARGEMFVVVARDETVQKIKGHTPRQSADERVQAIIEKYPQATVIIGHATDYLAPVRDIQPDCILLGYDQKFPPGIAEKDLPCPIERLAPFQPEKYKSSLQ